MASLPVGIFPNAETVDLLQYGDDDATGSHAMDEFLESKINQPLVNDGDSNHDNSIDLSVDAIDIVDKSLVESFDAAQIQQSLLLTDDNNITLSSWNKSLSQSRQVSKARKVLQKNVYPGNNFENNNLGDDCCNSSSEGTVDQQHSDHTYPETPPTPLSLESQRRSSSSSSSSDSISVHDLLVDSPSHHISARPMDNNNNIAQNILPPPTLLPSPTPRSNSIVSTKLDHLPMIKRSHSLSYNPITSHSPQRQSRTRRQRAATFGMSIFSCLDGDSDEALSESEHYHTSCVSKGIFRKRSAKVEIEDDDLIIDSFNSEEALEKAAQEIRSQLLQHEMLQLAAEAEQAADAGMDRFTRHPLAGVVQDDMIRCSATTKDFNVVKTSRRQSMHSMMRRSLSEGSYRPQIFPDGVTQIKRQPSSSFVSAIFPESILPLATTGNREKNHQANVLNTLRDVNEVFPTFGSFHQHIRTHLSRNDVSQSQLLFQEDEEKRDTSNTRGGIENWNSPSSSTPSRHLYDPFCKDSPGEMFPLPLCSTELTSTPLTVGRKTAAGVSPNRHPFLPLDPPIPKKDFLNGFELDQWTSTIGEEHKSNVNNSLVLEPSSPSNSDDKLPVDNDLLRIVSVIAGQLVPSMNQHAKYVPRTFQSLPGLDLQDDHMRTQIFRQMSSTIRLQPKISQRNYLASDNKFVSLLSKADLSYEQGPRALLDETENDSGDEDCDSVSIDRTKFFDSMMLEQKVSRSPTSSSIAGSLHAVSVSDPAYFLTPGVHREKLRSNSIVAADDDVVPAPPPPPLVPDFITPARLRRIRNGRRRSTSSDGGDTLLDAIAANLLLATESSSHDIANRNTFSRRNSVVKEYANSPNGHNSYDYKMSSEIEMFNQTLIDRDVDCVGELPRKAELTDRTNSTYIYKSLQSEIFNDSTNTGTGNCTDSNVEGDDCNVSILNNDIVADNILQPIEVPASTEVSPSRRTDLIDMSKSCRSLDGFTAKIPAHHDCGCLSLSPASSTCSVDVSYNIFQTNENEGNPNYMALRKSLSSGTLYEVKSWNAFMESFRSASPTFMDGSQNSATPTRRNSIRDAMKILSCKLSPSRTPNDKKEHEEQQRQANYARMKDNDEFISNFLYSSKSSDRLTEDVANTGFDITTEVNHNASSTQSSSFYTCMDKNIMNCGENNNGICCSGWFDGALTFSNVLGLPSSESSSLHQKRKRSSINVGGLPSTSIPQLHESFQSDYNRSIHNNSSSWLDLASAQLDGAFDSWVTGGNHQQPNTTEIDDIHACLLHVSFQAPALKKSINLMHTNDEYPLEVYPEIDDESKVDELSPSSFSSNN